MNKKDISEVNKYFGKLNVKPIKSKAIDAEAEAHDIKKYYKHFNLTKVANPKHVQNELLYQLYKEPKEKAKIHFAPNYKNEVIQCDLLYLPHDQGYKYVLVAVDIGSRLCDAEPLKNREATTVLKALERIFKRKIVNEPHEIVVDSGAEFQGEFINHFQSIGIKVRVAQVNRHRQVGLVESRNKSIGDWLMKRMTAQELNTGVVSTEWVKYLGEVVKRLNKKFEIKNPKPNESNEMKCLDGHCELLQIGDLVRHPLDYAINVHDEKRVHGKFRSADIKYSLRPTKITFIKLSPDNVPLYGLEGKKALYSKEVLIPVNSDKIRMPPKHLQAKHVVEKILDKKKIDDKVHFLIKWEDEPATWEPRTTLIKEIPDLIKAYDSK